MKYSLLPLLVAGFTFVATVLGSAEDMVTTLGAGGRTCGTWTEARRSGTTTVGYYQEWVAGFLSGANSIIVPEDKIDTLAQPNLDAQGLYAWVDNYCIAHPLNTIAQAADALGGELIHRAGVAKQNK
jgi:hypothetical protein